MATGQNIFKPVVVIVTIVMAGVVTEFLQSSTIHGLAYISARRRPVRLFWLGVVTTGFTLAGLLIQQSFLSWANSPISTTIETRPIGEIDFPNVTVCPSRNSFSSLNPDLVTSRNILFDDEKRKGLSDFVPYAAFEAAYSAYKREYEEFLTGGRKYTSWYKGISQMRVPYFDEFSKAKAYDFQTTALNGSFKTPYFGETFNVSLFDYSLDCSVFLYVPDNLTVGSKIVVDIDYEISDEQWKGSREYIYTYLQTKQTRNSSSYSYSWQDALAPSKKNAKIEISVAETSAEAM